MAGMVRLTLVPVVGIVPLVRMVGVVAFVGMVTVVRVVPLARVMGVTVLPCVLAPPFSVVRVAPFLGVVVIVRGIFLVRVVGVRTVMRSRVRGGTVVHTVLPVLLVVSAPLRMGVGRCLGHGRRRRRQRVRNGMRPCGCC
jgi:hypothetical protein